MSMFIFLITLEVEFVHLLCSIRFSFDLSTIQILLLLLNLKKLAREYYQPPTSIFLEYGQNMNMSRCRSGFADYS